MGDAASAEEVSCSGVEASQEDRFVVQRPHAVVDLFESNRLVLKSVAEKDRSILPFDLAGMIDATGFKMTGIFDGRQLLGIRPR